MSIIKEALKAVSNYPGGYGMIYEIIYGESPNGYKEKISESKKQVLKNTLSRMKKLGLLSNEKGFCKITKAGEQLLKERKSAFIIFPKQKTNKNTNKTMIVMFDIPEKKRLYRNWLRSELIGFNYELIQKSVWLGPSLPKEFVEYLDEKKLLQYIKFFKAIESDII